MNSVDFVRSLWAAVNADGPEAMRPFLAVDYVRHGSDKDYSLDEWIAVLAERSQAFPDNKSQVIDIIAQGDTVAYRWIAEGTHHNIYMRIPATGRKVVAQGITFSRLKNGRISEEWASWNKASVLHTLGILPIV